MMEGEIKGWHQQCIYFGLQPEKLQVEEEMTCLWDLGRISVIGLGKRGILFTGRRRKDRWCRSRGLALSLPSLLCKHQHHFGRWRPTLGQEPKRESKITSGDSCLLDTNAADSSSWAAAVMQKSEKDWRCVWKKRKRQRTRAVSCERRNVIHLVMVPRYSERLRSGGKNCP